MCIDYYGAVSMYAIAPSMLENEQHSEDAWTCLLPESQMDMELPFRSRKCSLEEVFWKVRTGKGRYQLINITGLWPGNCFDCTKVQSVMWAYLDIYPFFFAGRKGRWD